MHVVCDSSKCSLMSVSNLGKTVNREKTKLGSAHFLILRIYTYILSLSQRCVHIYTHFHVPTPFLRNGGSPLASLPPVSSCYVVTLTKLYSWKTLKIYSVLAEVSAFMCVCGLGILHMFVPTYTVGQAPWSLTSDIKHDTRIHF